MKNRYHMEKLNKVCNLQNGFAFKSTEYVDEGFFVMRITNVQDGRIELNNPKYIADNYPSKIDSFILKEDDILMSLTGNVGRVGIIKKEHLPAVLNQRVARISIKSESLLDRDYLFFFLRNPNFLNNVISGGKGMAQQNVSTSFIGDILIPIPSLEEQKKIVKILEEKLGKVKEAIKLREEVIADTEKILSSRLTEIFERGKSSGWRESKLGDVYIFNYGKGLSKFDRSDSGQYPVFGANGEIGRSDKYMIEGKGIIIGRKGSAGELTRISGRYWPTDVTYFVMEDKKYDTDFSYYLLKYLDLLQYVVGVKPGINRNQIYNLKINLPDLNVQVEIAKELDELSDQISELSKMQESQLADLKALEQAYLREAFSGELV